jgi:hypothetical protein
MEKPTLQKEREPSLLYTPYGKADPSERKSSIFTRHMEKPTLQRERVPSLHAIWKSRPFREKEFHLYMPYGKADPLGRKRAIFTPQREIQPFRKKKHFYPPYGKADT